MQGDWSRCDSFPRFRHLRRPPCASRAVSVKVQFRGGKANQFSGRVPQRPARRPRRRRRPWRAPAARGGAPLRDPGGPPDAGGPGAADAGAGRRARHLPQRGGGGVREPANGRVPRSAHRRRNAGASRSGLGPVDHRRPRPHTRTGRPMVPASAAPSSGGPRPGDQAAGRASRPRPVSPVALASSLPGRARRRARSGADLSAHARRTGASAGDDRLPGPGPRRLDGARAHARVLGLHPGA